MPLLDQNTFIVELGKLFDKQQTAGSVFVSMTMGMFAFLDRSAPSLPTFLVECALLLGRNPCTNAVGMALNRLNAVEPETKVKDDPCKTPVTEPRCLIRATDGASGKKKIKFSTIVRSTL